VLAAGCAAVQPLPADHPTGNVEVVHVALPTGEQAVDHASILAALGEVRPGGTVQFGPGGYLVGEIIRISKPRLTLLGHAAGTVLRGCHPEEYEALEWEAMRARPSDPMAGWKLMSRCGMLELTGGHVTVRDLTFEYTRMGLILGCCEGEDVLRSSEGGYLVEGNTFRNTGNSIRALLSSPEPTVIRGNRFINTFHALSAGVSHVHMVDNDISVPEPRSVPGAGHPGFAIGIRPPLVAPAGSPTDTAPVCQHNIIAGNRIQGHPDGIVIRVYEPGTSCRENTIRDNTIDVRRVPIPSPWVYADAVSLPAPGDSTFTGVPLGLINLAVASGSTEQDGDAGSLTGTRVEGNRIIGADGIGIEILNAAENRIAGNTITDGRRRDPFPGNTTGGTQAWAEANGSGIWISPGSNHNEVVHNTFEEIASFAVVVEGDSNRVAFDDPAAVRDAGAGNQVDRFADVNGVRLRYLDFGGHGLPLVFTPAMVLGVEDYVELATRLNDDYRVLVVGRRDEGGPVQWLGTRAHAEDLLGFLDALGIERAVLAGNTGPAFRMTYLAEEHPERVAGVIYLAGPPSAALDLYKEPASGGPMLMRLWGVGDGFLEEASYSFHYREDEEAEISVPALTFVSPTGIRGTETQPVPLLYVGSPLVADDIEAVRRSLDPSFRYFVRLFEDGSFRDEQLARIEDAEVRAYFQRLAGDEAMQAEVERFFAERVTPGELENWAAFKRAFGERLRVVELDVPVVTGYEYKIAPEMIEPHIRRFLQDVALREAARQPAPALDSQPRE
jgi:parallel beta-helix repeat protein